MKSCVKNTYRGHNASGQRWSGWGCAVALAVVALGTWGCQSSAFLTKHGWTIESQREKSASHSPVLYVSPKGNDGFSGLLPEVNGAKTDGPLATLTAARDKMRELKNGGLLRGPATVYLRGGRYALEQPVTFGPEDSAPVTYASYPGEQAVLDGGQPITGWQPVRVNDRDAWMVQIPEVKEGKWYFRELFVNGQRASRPRLPKTDAYRMTAIPQDKEYQLGKTNMGMIGFAFNCAPGQIQPDWRNFADIDMVLLHYWLEERSGIAKFDPERQLVVMARLPNQPLSEDGGHSLGRFYVENVFEALTEPGEWYLDRPSGNLYYLPRPGEDPARTQAIAPRPTQLLKLTGKPEEQRYVEFLRFRNLTFAHTDWNQPVIPAWQWKRSDLSMTGYGQASSHLSGAVQWQGARYCALEDCRFEHLGWFAIDLGDGCASDRIVGNEMCDLGAGGVKMNGADAGGPVLRRTGNNRVTDNHIHDCGRVFPSAVGILAMHTFGNTISHNDIHDLYYSGINCGWVWGYGPTVSSDNRIECNHIHHIRGLLSDMGGIYTLGMQSGTVIRGNLIHDLEAVSASCIYPDEGSSYLLVENNVCYNTIANVFFQHFGRENIVRNNIFAFGGGSTIALARPEDQNAFTLEHNLILTHGQPFYGGGYVGGLQDRKFQADLNLLWDTAGTPMMGQNINAGRTFDAQQWHDLGQDGHSVVADPLVKGLAKHDFRVSDHSPALALGFRPIDLSGVGPRPASQHD